MLLEEGREGQGTTNPDGSLFQYPEQAKIVAQAREYVLPQGQGGDYSKQEVLATDMETFFKRIVQPDPAYGAFAGLRALVLKGKEDPSSKDKIGARACEIIRDASQDTSNPYHQQWQLCYVVSGVRYEPGIPVLEKVLLENHNETFRGVAACALGKFYNEQALAALKGASKTEKDTKVQDWIKKALNGELKGME